MCQSRPTGVAWRPDEASGRHQQALVQLGGAVLRIAADGVGVAFAQIVRRQDVDRADLVAQIGGVPRDIGPARLLLKWSRSSSVTLSKWSDRTRAANMPARLPPTTTAQRRREMAKRPAPSKSRLVHMRSSLSRSETGAWNKHYVGEPDGTGGRPIGDRSPGQPCRPTLLMGNGKGLALRFLRGTCGSLGNSCGHPELPRCEADEALEVIGELALVREARVGGNLR